MNYATIKYNDIANGEGVRTSLFVSGCTHRCKNCFNEAVWDFNYGELFSQKQIDDILKSIEPSYISGLTLLGGEPMERANQKGIINLIRQYKKTFPDKTLWCYTGYTYEVDLFEGGRAFGEYTKELLSYIDVLVDGKFIQELYDISLKFRGSSNQRLIDVKKSQKENKVCLWGE